MTRDANQIAQEYARHQSLGEALQPPRAEVPPFTPRQGTLTVMSGFGDMATVLGTMNRVTVQFTDSGLIVATYPDGVKQAFRPISGWCLIFEPNDEGE